MRKMETWQIDFEWLRIRHFLKDVAEQENLPDLNNILLLIGIRELGQTRDEWTKEEKRDLMNIAACVLLEMEGYYTFKGLDDDGCPHYTMLKPFELKGVKNQEERSEEHTSELQSRGHLVCRLLLEKKTLQT